MPILPAAALLDFQRHLGLATIQMLANAGVSRGTRHRLVLQGILSVEHRGVYRINSSVPTLESRCLALCLAYSRGFVTGPTGAKLVGLRRIPSPEPIHFSVPHGFHLQSIPGVILRQSTSIEPMDTMRWPNGLNLASWPRLGFDLSQDLVETDLASVIEQLLADRRCSLGTLAAVGRRLVHSARRGSVNFSRVLLQRVPGGPLESHPEVILARALIARGVPVVAQVRTLALPDGGKIRVDLAVTAVRWAVEIDVHPDHLSLEGTTKDKRRDRQCHLIDWVVERVTALDLLDIDAIADELCALYQARLRQVG